MAVRNPVALPLKYSLNKHGLVAAKKEYASGTNLSKTLIGYLLNSGDSELHGDRRLPATLDNSQAIHAHLIVSSPAAGAGGEKIRLEFAYRALAATESSDYSSWQETVASSVDVSSWSAKSYRQVQLTLTNGNFAVDDLIEFVVRRYPTHTDDNHAQNILLHDVSLSVVF